MAQWTFIDPNTLLPGDPWTSAKAQAAFENLEAVAEGAPGAPRNEILSFERLMPGTQEKKNDNSAFTAGDSGVALFATGFMQYGSVRANFQFRRDGVGTEPTLALTRLRDTSLTNLYTTNASNTSFVESPNIDFNILPGDTVYIRRIGGNAPIRARNFRISTSGGSLFPTAAFTYTKGFPNET